MRTPYRVLLANGDPVERCSLTALLSGAGYDTIAAASFEEARHALERRAPDLLIAHLRLGEFNGLHLFLRGRAHNPHMAAIITTGPEDTDIKIEALQFGVLCVLTRMFTPDFLPTIAKLIERRGSPAWH
ncbi:MAG TPA: response regulator [Vicinamibacterales bacterium]